MEDKKYLLTERELDITAIFNVPIEELEAFKRAHEYRDRTCSDFGGEEGTNGEGYDFACSACGYCCDVTEPNYCPHCGAEVVEDV